MPAYIPQKQEALFKYMRYLPRFVARSRYWENESTKAKAGKRYRKKEVVVPAEAGDGNGGH